VKFFTKEFILYSIIGFSGLFIDLGLFWCFAEILDLNYQISNFLSTSVGISNNFILNAYFNFKKKDRIWLRYCKFYLVGCLGIVLTALTLYMGIEVFYCNAFLMKCISIVFVLIVQFALNKRFSFN